MNRTYLITTPTTILAIVLDEQERVDCTPPAIDWMAGLHIDEVERYCLSYGWQLEQVRRISNDHPTCIEDSGIRYMLTWKGSRCISVARHEPGTRPCEMHFSELPDSVQELIYDKI